MLTLGRLSIHRLQMRRTHLSSSWIVTSSAVQLSTKKRAVTRKRVDALTVNDPESFASAIVSLLKQSEVTEHCTALKEMRNNPNIEPKAMGSLMKANNTHSNWFKQWVENIINGTYSKVFPINIPLDGSEMLDAKAKLAATMFMIRSSSVVWAEDQSLEDEDADSRSATELQSSEIADELGNNIQLSRLNKLSDILVEYSEGKYASPSYFLGRIKTTMECYVDYCLPMLDFMNIELPPDWKVLVHLQKEKRLSVIAELANDIALLSSRNSSRVSSSSSSASVHQPISTTTSLPPLASTLPQKPSVTPSWIRKYCLKLNGQVLRFDLHLKCYSLTSHKSKTQPYGFQSLLEKNRNLYDPNWQNQSDIMYKVNKEFTASPSSSLLDFLDGPEVNLSTRKSVMDREAEMIEQKLKKIEEDQTVINEVETSLIGNIPSFLRRDDSEVFSRRVIIDNLPEGIEQLDIHQALMRCGGVSECHLYLETSRPSFPTVIPAELVMSKAEIENRKKEEEYQKQLQLHKEEQEKALKEIPDEYHKNGKLKKKKLPKNLEEPVPSVGLRISNRKKVLEEEKNGNYAVLTMDSEESFAAVTRAAIKLFGICIRGNLCKVTPVSEFKKFTVQIGDKQDVRTATHLINEVLGEEFECHIATSQVSDSSRPLYITLEFESHEEGWSAFDKLYRAYKEQQKPLYPAWIESPHYHKLMKKALAQKTFVSVDLPQGVVVDECDVREEPPFPSSATYSLSSFMDHPESGVSEQLGKMAARKATRTEKARAAQGAGKIRLDELTKIDADKTTAALPSAAMDAASIGDVSSNSSDLEWGKLRT